MEVSIPHFPRGKLSRRDRCENCLARKKRDACHWLGIFTSARLFRLTYNRWGKQENSRSLFLNKKKEKRLFEWVYISIILSSPFTLTLGQDLRRFSQVSLILHFFLYCGLDSLNCPWPGNRVYTWSSFEGLMNFEVWYRIIINNCQLLITKIVPQRNTRTSLCGGVNFHLQVELSLDGIVLSRGTPRNFHSIKLKLVSLFKHYTLVASDIQLWSTRLIH